MEFIDLKTQYQRLKADIDACIHRVLYHGQYILGLEVAVNLPKGDEASEQVISLLMGPYLTEPNKYPIAHFLAVI
jgi:hypothetical protein